MTQFTARWRDPNPGLARNLRDLPRYLTPSTLSAGLVAALMGVTGPALLVFQAARNAHLSSDDLNSWVFAIFVGGGLVSWILGLLYRQPICGAYSIAGSAMLVTILPHYTLPEAVFAYLVSGVLIAAIGFSGVFGWLMDRIPGEIVMGMLAGVLFRFGLGIFTPLAASPVLVLAMIVVFLAMQRRGGRVPPVAGALVVGGLLAVALGQVDLGSIPLAVSAPRLYTPVFAADSILSIAIPLALLALASQNAPGIGILWAQGYRAPTNAITIVSGLGSIITAFFAGHGLNIAAPMTAICSGPDSHPELEGRYAASILNGLFFILFGLLGATATAIFAAFPEAVIGTVAGLAMVPVLLQAFRRSVGQEKHLYGAFFALLIAASGVTLLGVSATFWSLLGGMAVSRVLDRPAPAPPAAPQPARAAGQEG